MPGNPRPVDVEYRTLPWCPRYKIGSDGSIIGPSGRKLKPAWLPPLGYRLVLIYAGKGKRGRVTRSVHLLVCEAFHGPKPTPKHEVAHWDGDPGNNVPANLRWATRAENMADKIRHGRVSRTSGEIDGMSKLKTADVIEIRRRAAAGESQRVLAREFGVKQPTISNIFTRTTWGHL